MEPTLTSELFPASLEDPVTEIQDLDRVVQFYSPPDSPLHCGAIGYWQTRRQRRSNRVAPGNLGSH
jgi:hypothetical protein